MAFNLMELCAEKHEPPPPPADPPIHPIDPASLEIMWCRWDWTTQRIAKQLKVTMGCVWRTLGHWGITKHDFTPKEPSRSSRTPDPGPTTLENLYGEKKLTIVEVARELNLSPGTVRRYMEKHNIRRRPPGPEAKNHPTCAELRQLYGEEGLSLKKMGMRLGVSHGSVRNWLEKCGIERRPAGPRPADGRPGRIQSAPTAPAPAPVPTSTPTPIPPNPLFVERIRRLKQKPPPTSPRRSQ